MLQETFETKNIATVGQPSCFWNFFNEFFFIHAQNNSFKLKKEISKREKYKGVPNQIMRYISASPIQRNYRFSLQRRSILGPADKSIRKKATEKQTWMNGNYSSRLEKVRLKN